MTSPQHRLLILSALTLGSLVYAVDVQSQAPASSSRARVVVAGHEAVAGEVLVMFREGVDPAAPRAMGQQVDAEENVPVGRRGLRRYRSRSFDVETLLSFFRADPSVVVAEPNYVVRAVATPNDPRFPDLWGLLNTGQIVSQSAGTPGADIHAAAAWDLTTGSRGTAVGIIDTGVDYTHPDLAANVWSAPAAFTVTIGGVPLTCPAGSHGFNAIDRTCDPMDNNNHGTHVAGTIGAVGNNGRGVAGVNWTTSILAGKFLDASGSGTTSNAIDAIDFLIQTKAAFAATGEANVRVLNNSWGGGGFSAALQDAIASANTNGMLFVAAAGNGGSDHVGDNNDAVPFYPASYDVPNVVAVAATDNTDTRASFSNYGASSVDLAAPGVSIVSTTIGNTYSTFSGTSMAAPHVAGAAALVLSACPLDTPGVKNALLSAVDTLGSLSGVVLTAGRLNVDRAVRLCGSPEAPQAPTGLTATAGNGQVTLSWTPSAGATNYRIKRSVSTGGPYALVASVGSSPYVDTGLASGAAYFYVVSAGNGVGESPNSAEASATPLLAVPLAPAQLKAQPGNARVSLSWLASSGASAYRLKRSLVKTGPYAPLADVTGLAFTDTAVANGTTYFYVVTAVNDAGESKNSNKASAMPAPIPLAPAGVVAATGATAGEINLSWNASVWATTYRVKRSTHNGGPYSGVHKVTTLGLTDTGRHSGTTYYYVITAINTSGESGDSVQASAVAR